ncbi:hypothetical protein HY009_09795 [Candidatus Acetothermia bacterium]|nr:hypothetical protein [Candidatus Acetothermia bacterium]
MKLGRKLTVLALVGIGVLTLIGLGQIGKLFTGSPADVAIASTSSSFSNGSSYIQLSQDQKVKLDEFRGKLTGVWAEVNAQKKLLDEQINPQLARLYGTHAAPVPGTLAEHNQAYLNGTLYARVTALQQELAQLEGEALWVGQKANSFEQGILADNPGKQLDKVANNAFNGLRNKVAVIVSLIMDVYNDDPPCPACDP